MLTRNGLCTIVTMYSPGLVIFTFHKDISYWDVETTKQLILHRVWWPYCQKDIIDYVKSCNGCQRHKPIEKCRTTLHLPISLLFDTFSIDVMEPFRRANVRLKCILIAVQHCMGWPTANKRENATAHCVISFSETEVAYSFSPPHTIVSDNTNWVSASKLMDFMKHQGMKRKPDIA